MSWTIPLFIVGLMAILFLWEPMWDAIEEHNRRVAQKRRAQRTRDPNLGYTPPPTAHANIALTPPLGAVLSTAGLLPNAGRTWDTTLSLWPLTVCASHIGGATWVSSCEARARRRRTPRKTTRRKGSIRER